MASVTVDLAAAGLTHAKGKSDRCGTDGHDIDWTAIKDWENPDLIDFDAIGPALQALHEQAHPRGAAFWQNCRDPGCLELSDL
jgi:hypothetical protein